MSKSQLGTLLVGESNRSGQARMTRVYWTPITSPRRRPGMKRKGKTVG